MDLYTNDVGSRYYTSDRYVKHLHKVRITSVKEWVAAGLDPLVLFGVHHIFSGRKHEVEYVPASVKDAVQLPDFIANRPRLAVLRELRTCAALTALFLNTLTLYEVFESVTRHVSSRGCVWAIEDDDDALSISILRGGG